MANSGSFKKGSTPWNKGKTLVPKDEQRKKRNTTARKNYQNNKEKKQQKSREWYKKNVEKERKRVKEERIRHKDRYEARDLAVKLEVLIHYSKGDKPACVCCGIDDSHEFLTIDHITSKKEMGKKSSDKGQKLYRRLKRERFPVGYQTLCWNCNSAKSDNGICPHQFLDGETL
tara:strand:+ start:55 stop:573 length:519 start_codon:yes stop_codon:yes gene_type:complete